jgi:hypothetical protein
LNGDIIRPLTPVEVGRMGLDRHRIDELNRNNRYPWLRIVTEDLDAWVASQMQAYVPPRRPVLSLDLRGTERKVFALFDRALQRRNELLQLQQQSYLQALRYDYAVAGRDLAADIIHTTTRLEEADVTRASMRRAADAFRQTKELGWSAQSTGRADADDHLSHNEAARRTSLVEQMRLQAAHEDDLQLLHTVLRGPFDYAGRYERSKWLCLNDFQSFVDAFQSYLEGARFYGLTVPEGLDFKTTDFIWGAGAAMQEIARQQYQRLAARTVRRVTVTAGWTRWSKQTAAADLGDMPFKRSASSATGMTLDEFRGFMTPWMTPSDGHGWKRVYFSLSQDVLKRAGLGTGQAADLRIEEVGVEWILTRPTYRSDSDQTSLDMNQAVEYQMRNQRGVRIPCVLSVPAVPTPLRLPAEDVQFPAACTTDEGVEHVITNSDPMIVGRSPIGVWSVDIGEPQRHGENVKRLLNNPSALIGGGVQNPELNPEYPNICGCRLHLQISARLLPAAVEER